MDTNILMEPEIETSNNSNQKRRRTQISLAVKLKIIQAIETGAKITRIAQMYELHEATIRTIRKNAVAIKKAVTESTPTSCRVVKYARSSIMVKMEKLLIEWIKECYRNHISVDTRSIQNKALSIFDNLKEENDKNQKEDMDKAKSVKFVASKGWFEKFKHRYDLDKIKCGGEVENGDEVTATEFVECFNDFIEKLNDSELPANSLEGCTEREPEEEQQPEEDEEFEEDEEIDLFTAENIKGAINMIEKGVDFIRTIDHDSKRSSSIGKELKAAIAPYKNILREKKRLSGQPSLGRFSNSSVSTSLITTDITVDNPSKTNSKNW